MRGFHTTVGLVLLSTAGAHAQTLLTTDDGVSLRGTVRLLQGNAATCNVIAENEQGSYEAMRVNQDQPLHLWELEFSVFNGSGRALDHLIAYYDIASPWPPCTNWTHQYEGLGSYQWADPSGHIQHTGRSMPTLPNQTHAETIRVLAFNGVRPQFTDWSVNYTFLDGGTTTAATAAPDSANQTANLSVRDASPIEPGLDIFFGDDSSIWANDGECDDPRFEGPGAFTEPLEEEMFRDATDCRELFERGEVLLAEATPTASPLPMADGQDVSFGDDSSIWAKDGECDDPRFEGPGAANTLLEEDLLRDATDCRVLFEREQIWLSEADLSVGASPIEAGQNTTQADESDCTLSRLIGIGTVRSSLNPTVTMRFAETHFTTTMSVGGDSTTIESEILGVDSDSITYRLVRTTSTTGDAPIRNPGPHTVNCSFAPSGDVLVFGDGSWS